MKILVLNPHIDAQHQVALALKAEGMAVLFPSSAEDAWQVLQLHSESLDLVLIHREAVQGSEVGLEFLYRIKKDPAFADLPVILTSEVWSEDRCSQHQQTSLGANAYLIWPFDGATLVQSIQKIFGLETAVVSLSTPQSSLNEAAQPEPPSVGEFILEDPTGFLDQNPQPSVSFQLDAPDGSVERGSKSFENPIAVENSIEIISSSESSLSGSFSENAPKIEESFDPGSMIQLEASVTSEKIAPRVASASSTPSDLSPSKIQEADLSFQVEAELPYLFKNRENDSNKSVLSAPGIDPPFVQPLGDVVVPGGAAHSPDTETLKKYLLLREQDVAALSIQVKAARDELASVKQKLQTEAKRSNDLEFANSELGRKLGDFERDKNFALEGVQAELNELRFQSKMKADRSKMLEAQVKEATDQIEKLKDRVRSDIRKIRVRERELENKLEILKKDSEALLTAREVKILELKRKLDLLEFNMDLLQNKYNREKEVSLKLKEKLLKAAQIFRVAEGLLDESPVDQSISDGSSQKVESKAS